jgi:hypothetical protein
MHDPRLEARASGIELQLNELTGQLGRARRAGQTDAAASIERAIADLVDELARTEEALARPQPRARIHGATQAA